MEKNSYIIELMMFILVKVVMNIIIMITVILKVFQNKDVKNVHEVLFAMANWRIYLFMNNIGQMKIFQMEYIAFQREYFNAVKLKYIRNCIKEI